MKNALIFSCLITLLLFSYSAAQDKPFSGGVFLGGRALNLDHQSAKFNEYNGIGPGAFGGANMSYDTESYHITADGAYLGDDDAYIGLKGGQWGCFKYSLFYNEFPHNLSFKNRTIYISPGSEDLTFNGPAASIPRNSAAWPSTSFDYRVKRKDLGGAFELSTLNPFFFTVDANRLERDGQIPWGQPSGLGRSFGRMVEFPLPIENTTTNIHAMGGYKSKLFYAAFGGGFSKFTDQAEFVRYRDPYSPGAFVVTDTTVGAPDNKSWNVKFNGNAKLPFSSTFALTGGYQRNTSETTLLRTVEDMLSAADPRYPFAANVPFVTTLGIDRSKFHGDVRYWNVNAGLTSNPWKSLNTKIYFKYIDRQNDSDFVTFTNPFTGDTASNEIFDYSRTSAGGEASYRFTRCLKGILGYEFSDLRRSAHEVEPVTGEVETGPLHPQVRIKREWDNKVAAQLLYQPLDWLGGRLKYQNLNRNARFDLANLARVPFSTTNPNYLTYVNGTIDDFKRDFFWADKDQDMFKVTLDFTPRPEANLTLEYAYKYDDYHKTVLGYQDARRNEFILDGAYEWKGIKFFAFFDYEDSYTRQQTRQFTPSAVADPNPNAAPNASSFNWEARLNNINYAYGIGTAFPIIRNKLSFTVQYDFEKNNGDADFTSQFLAANLNQDIIDIAPWDDYTRQTISAKLKYDVTKDMGLVFGYLYSQFKWNDGQFKGYQYAMPATGAVNSYLSGAYTDQTYNANIYYVKVIYRF